MGVHISATWRIRLNRQCAAAMRPFCQIILTTCCYYYHHRRRHLSRVYFFSQSTSSTSVNIFALWFLSFFFYLCPCLISVAADTSTHGVALVRI